MSRTKATKAAAKTLSPRTREAWGIVFLGICLFVSLSLVSFQIGTTVMGPCGTAVGLGVYAIFGVGAYLIIFAAAAWALGLLAGKPMSLPLGTASTWLGAGLAASILVHLSLRNYRVHSYGPGGLLGEYAAELLASLIGTMGAAILSLMVLGVCTVLGTSVSVSELLAKSKRGIAIGKNGLLQSILWIFPAHNESVFQEQTVRQKAHQDDTLVEARGGKSADDATHSDIALDDREPTAVPAPSATSLVRGAVPKIVESAALKRLQQPLENQHGVLEKPEHSPLRDYIPAGKNYLLPDLGLLEYEEPKGAALEGRSKQEMLALADKLQKTLADYGVRGHVQEIHPGPVVTMYEFVPQAGTKLSKITGLTSDLAMVLAAQRVRIVAPIPGKSSVGIEVPNRNRATVYLKEILIDEQVQKAKSRLTLGIGKDISGAPVAVDLARMPHLLVAGTTGSGKSVAVNGMICSILFHATPDEVRLIMIDPKMVELSIYDGIPHLLLPVVTDPKKANLALRWAVEEMERRYEAVSKAGVRDLVAYNKKIEKLVHQPAAPVGSAAPTEPLKKLPYIVVIIDEFADLMMVASKEVETSVARIAQKARAVGIHLILATQRPSVDVITGLIKANFPSRIAFQVASKIDSRTILDQSGAENLLGMGDMLFTDRGQALRRVHGALVNDLEIKQIVEHLKNQGKPVYDLDILKPREEEGEAGSFAQDEGTDPVYDAAVRLVCETRLASVSMIQRRFQIGFNRAARLVERMEREGIVGGANGAKPREVIAQAI